MLPKPQPLGCGFFVPEPYLHSTKTLVVLSSEFGVLMNTHADGAQSVVSPRWSEA